MICCFYSTLMNISLMWCFCTLNKSFLTYVFIYLRMDTRFSRLVARVDACFAGSPALASTYAAVFSATTGNGNHSEHAGVVPGSALPLSGSARVNKDHAESASMNQPIAAEEEIVMLQELLDAVEWLAVPRPLHSVLELVRRVRGNLHSTTLPESTEANITALNVTHVMDYTECQPRLRLAEQLLLARAVLQIQHGLFVVLIKNTMPVSDAIFYWESVSSSILATVEHMILALPERLTQKASSAWLWKTPSIPTWRSISSSTWTLSWMSTKTATSWLFNLNPIGILRRERRLVASKQRRLEILRRDEAERLGWLDQSMALMLQRLSGMENDLAAGNAFLQFFNDVENKILGSKSSSFSPAQTSSYMNLIDRVYDAFEYIATWIHSPALFASLRHAYMPLRPPSLSVRYGFPAAIVGLALLIGSKPVVSGRMMIGSWLTEAAMTVRSFVIGWVWQPLLDVYHTIRHDQRIHDGVAMALVSTEGVRCDVESLERMVTDFASRRANMSAIEATAAAQKATMGDLSIVMQHYERSIQSPLMSSITGDLIETVLIQVQKAKVDLDGVLFALEKLLRSNQLNFAMIALAPSLLLIGAGYSWITGLLRQRQGLLFGRYIDVVRVSLRDIERVLMLNRTGQETAFGLSAAAQGQLLLDLFVLRERMKSSTFRNSFLYSRFVEDLEDIGSPLLTIEQRLETTKRLYRTYPFISA